MTSSFVEEKQKFTFSDSWLVAKWDASNAYLNGIRKLIGTKAVDFVGLLIGSVPELYWIEVKDFRGYRIENKRRVSNGNLANEIGQKVRDTIAGVAGACVTRDRSDPWRSIVRAIQNSEVRVKVILCLEEDVPPGPHGRQQNRRSVLLDELKVQLAWLTARVAVADKSLDNYPPGLTVADLPGAGMA